MRRAGAIEGRASKARAAFTAAPPSRRLGGALRRRRLCLGTCVGLGRSKAARAKLARPSLRRRLVGAWAALCAAAGFVWAHASGWGDRKAARARLARPSLRRRLVGAWAALCAAAGFVWAHASGWGDRKAARAKLARPSLRRRLVGAWAALCAAADFVWGSAQTASGVTG